jgi:cell division transport system ATP-binding protein
VTAAAASSAPLLEFRRVGKRFGDRVVLDDLSFQVARNEFVLLLGPSGAGKTTVLRLIAALEAPTEGEITVAGQALFRIRRRGLPLLRRSIGLVLHDAMLFGRSQRAAEHRAAADRGGRRPRDSLERAEAALQRVGLAEIDGHAFPPPVAISASAQRSRVRSSLLARCCWSMNRPRIWIIHRQAA